MPRQLLARCQPDSIREFLDSAKERYHDGLVAAGQGRSLAAIYLWGYSAEMNLKAAYFRLIGVGLNVHLTMPGHILCAIQRGRSLQISWPRRGDGHNVRAWAELLVLERAMGPGAGYTNNFALAVQRNGQQIGQLWNETLRYHKNVAYPYEVRKVRLAAEWFLIHQQQL